MAKSQYFPLLKPLISPLLHCFAKILQKKEKHISLYTNQIYPLFAFCIFAFPSHFSNKQERYRFPEDGNWELSVVKPRYITHQSFVAGAFYGALGKELAVLFFREQFPLMGLHSQKTVGGLKLGQANGGLPP